EADQVPDLRPGTLRASRRRRKRRTETRSRQGNTSRAVARMPSRRELQFSLLNSGYIVNASSRNPNSRRQSENSGRFFRKFCLQRDLDTFHRAFATRSKCTGTPWLCQKSKLALDASHLKVLAAVFTL
ncbi:unnamed protein product, partial [Ixodes pacificus]